MKATKIPMNRNPTARAVKILLMRIQKNMRFPTEKKKPIIRNDQKKIKHGKIKNPRILAIRESRYRNSRNCSTFPGISLFDHFFAVCAADEIIDAGVVIICQPDKHFDRNITGSRFIMGIRTLTDMKNLT